MNWIPFGCKFGRQRLFCVISPFYLNSNGADCTYTNCIIIILLLINRIIKTACSFFTHWWRTWACWIPSSFPVPCGIHVWLATAPSGHFSDSLAPPPTGVASWSLSCGAMPTFSISSCAIWPPPRDRYWPAKTPSFGFCRLRQSGSFRRACIFCSWRIRRKYFAAEQRTHAESALPRLFRFCVPAFRHTILYRKSRSNFPTVSGYWILPFKKTSLKAWIRRPLYNIFIPKLFVFSYSDDFPFPPRLHDCRCPSGWELGRICKGFVIKAGIDGPNHSVSRVKAGKRAAVRERLVQWRAVRARPTRLHNSRIEIWTLSRRNDTIFFVENSFCRKLV